jgi:hypothetical protein
MDVYKLFSSDSVVVFVSYVAASRPDAIVSNDDMSAGDMHSNHTAKVLYKYTKDCI